MTAEPFPTDDETLDLLALAFEPDAAPPPHHTPSTGEQQSDA